MEPRLSSKIDRYQIGPSTGIHAIQKEKAKKKRGLFGRSKKQEEEEKEPIPKPKPSKALAKEDTFVKQGIEMLKKLGLEGDELPEG